MELLNDFLENKQTQRKETKDCSACRYSECITNMQSLYELAATFSNHPDTAKSDKED